MSKNERAIKTVRFHQPVQFAGNLGMTALIAASDRTSIAFTDNGILVKQDVVVKDQPAEMTDFIPMTSVQIIRLK